jgi:hypothetical protein
MSRFLVISYDDDRQQVFYDLVLATDTNRAKQMIQVLRPYAVAIDRPAIALLCGLRPSSDWRVL